MPTQEERITSLEFNLDQFKTETMHSYSDMAYRITMLQGFTEDSIKRLASLHNDVGSLSADVQEFKFEVRNRFDRLDVRIDSVLAALARLEDK